MRVADTPAAEARVGLLVTVVTVLVSWLGALYEVDESPVLPNEPESPPVLALALPESAVLEVLESELPSAVELDEVVVVVVFVMIVVDRLIHL